MTTPPVDIERNPAALDDTEADVAGHTAAGGSALKPRERLIGRLEGTDQLEVAALLGRLPVLPLPIEEILVSGSWLESGQRETRLLCFMTWHRWVLEDVLGVLLPLAAWHAHRTGNRFWSTNPDAWMRFRSAVLEASWKDAESRVRKSAPVLRPADRTAFIGEWIDSLFWICPRGLKGWTDWAVLVGAGRIAREFNSLSPALPLSRLAEMSGVSDKTVGESLKRLSLDRLPRVSDPVGGKAARYLLQLPRLNSSSYRSPSTGNVLVKGRPVLRRVESLPLDWLQLPAFQWGVLGPSAFYILSHLDEVTARPAAEIRHATGMTKASLDRHLSKLKAHGLVSNDGRRPPFPLLRELLIEIGHGQPERRARSKALLREVRRQHFGTRELHRLAPEMVETVVVIDSRWAVDVNGEKVELTKEGLDAHIAGQGNVQNSTDDVVEPPALYVPVVRQDDLVRPVCAPQPVSRVPSAIEVDALALEVVPG